MPGIHAREQRIGDDKVALILAARLRWFHDVDGAAAFGYRVADPRGDHLAVLAQDPLKSGYGTYLLDLLHDR